MTTNVTVHDVEKVIIERHVASGVSWTEFAVVTSEGRQVELTVFHETDDLIIVDGEGSTEFGKVDLLSPGRTV